TLTACGSSKEKDSKHKDKSKTEKTSHVKEKKKKEKETKEKEKKKDTKKEKDTPVTCQAILDEYTQKIKQAAPKLATEYNEEVAQSINGPDDFAIIAKEKIKTLSDINDQGLKKMAK